MDQKPLLVLGVGNRILSDDGIGIRLIEDLQEQFSHQPIEFKDACCGGLEIVEIMQGYDNVIIIDGIKTEYGSPGSIYTFTVEDFKETLHISSFHDISFLIALEFGKKSGLQIPKNIKIVAIEIVEDMIFDENLSPEIAEHYDSIKADVADLLKDQLEVLVLNGSEALT